MTMVLLAAGCGDDGGGGGGDQAVVELGTGTIEFEALDTDDELELIAGPQGGHHFIVHARAQNIIPGDASIPGLEANPRTIFQAFTEAGNQIDLMFPPYTLGYRRLDSDWLALPSGRILQVDDDIVSQIVGARIRIRVQVTDANGARANDELWIVVTEAPIADNDAGSFDAGIDAPPPDAASSL